MGNVAPGLQLKDGGVRWHPVPREPEGDAPTSRPSHVPASAMSGTPIPCPSSATGWTASGSASHCTRGGHRCGDRPDRHGAGARHGRGPTMSPAGHARRRRACRVREASRGARARRWRTAAPKRSSTHAPPRDTRGECARDSPTGAGTVDSAPPCIRRRPARSRGCETTCGRQG